MYRTLIVVAVLALTVSCAFAATQDIGITVTAGESILSSGSPSFAITAPAIAGSVPDVASTTPTSTLDYNVIGTVNTNTIDATMGVANLVPAGLTLTVACTAAAGPTTPAPATYGTLGSIKDTASFVGGGAVTGATVINGIGTCATDGKPAIMTYGLTVSNLADLQAFTGSKTMTVIYTLTDN